MESIPDPWVVGASVGFTIPLSGRLEVEKVRAGAEQVAAFARVAREEWAIIDELRTTWLEWSAARLRSEVTGELAAQLESIVSAVDRLEQAGELPRLESRLFRIEAATASDGSCSGREIAGAGVQLKELLGLRPDAPVTLVPEIVAADFLPWANPQSLCILYTVEEIFYSFTHSRNLS